MYEPGCVIVAPDVPPGIAVSPTAVLAAGMRL
jgi:hypothetical protein